MLISRRGFLSLLGVAGIETALFPIATLGADGNEYTSSEFGFSLIKPKSWDFYSTKAFQKLEFTEETEPYAKLQAEYKECAEDYPVVVMSGYPICSEGFFPSVQVIVDTDVVDEPFFDLCRLVPYELQKIYQNYSIIKNVNELSICGFDAAEFAHDFTITHGGRSYALRVLYTMVETKNAYLVFAFEADPEYFISGAKEFQYVKSAIKVW